MSPIRPIQLIVYGRPYCHLCEELLQDLAKHPLQAKFTIEVCNIDDDPALEDLYGEKIPVLAAKIARSQSSNWEIREICHHRLNLIAFDTFLKAWQ